MANTKKNRRKNAPTKSSSRTRKHPNRELQELGRAEKLIGQQKFDQARQIVDKILQRKPGHPQALGVQGQIFYRQGDLDKAISCQQEALKKNPKDPVFHFNLGVFFAKSNRLDEAVDAYQQALEVDSEYTNAINNLALVYHRRKNHDEAIRLLNRLLEIKPDFGPAYLNLGEAYNDKGSMKKAIKAYEKGLEFLPDSPSNLNNLGVLYRKSQKGSLAIETFKKALALAPNSVATYNNLGSIYMDLGRLEEAFSSLKTALDLEPSYFPAITNYLFSLNYPSNLEAAEIFAEHKRFGAIIDQGGEPFRRSHTRPIAGNAPIRIGYVSADFRHHAVANFIEPILVNHNRSAFEIVCYFNGPHPDKKTLELKKLANKWRDIFYIDDQEAASLIEKDEIDILVDLVGHTGNSRLGVFAMKPAPIQVTYIGYPNTTGMQTIDYRITDHYADPAGTTEHLHTETLVRMPDCFLCYGPPTEPLPITPLPCQDNGHITFASFNNRPKITDEAVHCWAQILEKVPNSKLMLKSVHLTDENAKNDLLQKFTNLGIDKDRVDIRGAVQHYLDHLKLYNEVDIALDTFPYNGTTTTFEALWMGVPVVTLRGETHVSLVSSSILHQIDLDNFSATREDEYIALAISLASNPEELARLRQTLRQTLASSPACNAPQFTRNLENAYREMVATWNKQLPESAAQGQSPSFSSEEFRHLGEQLFKANQFDEARDALQKAVNLDPNNEIALNNLGVLLWQTGDTQGALAAFQQAITVNPEYVNAIDNLTALFDAINNNTSAPEPAGVAASQPSQPTSPLVQFGVELLNQKKYTEAAQAFEKALETNPQDDSAYTNMGLLHWQTENLQGAITNLSQAIKINPANLEAIDTLKTVFSKLAESQGRQQGVITATAQPTLEEQQTTPAQPSKEPIRILHQLARSGGTLISKCLGCMHDTMLLSEIHPLGGQWFNPLQQAQQWYQLFTPEEVGAINQQGNLSFKDAIDLIYLRSLELNRPLVIRDWSHLDFMAIPFVDTPSYDFSISTVLAEKFEIIEFATTRHPIDQWLSLSKLSIMKDKLSLDQFLYGYKKFAEQCQKTGFIRYEDFIDDPQTKMQELCSKLSLAYDPGFIDKWWRYDKMTGDTQSIRGDKKEIKRVPRYPISDKLLIQFVNNKHYHESLSLFGYRHPE